MDILINPVASLVERLVNKLIDESYFCCCVNSIVEDFEKERENLKVAKLTVEKDVKAAHDAGEDILEKVEKWQQNAKDLIDEETKSKQRCFFNLCPNCISRYKRGKDLTQKKDDITKLIGEQSNFAKVGRPAEGPGIKFHSSSDYMDFESRKSAKKELLDALANRSNYLIGLQGMGGCGKSHLVKQLGNEVQNSESKLFDRVIYVVVSNFPDFTKIRFDIAIHLGLKLEEGKEVHPEKLYSRLTNGEKILIILDDVWKDLKLREDIGIPRDEDHSSNCCVLITTRNQQVCISMGCQSLIELKTLSKEDAWTLLKKLAALSDNLSDAFKKVGQEIAEECQRLPVSIAAIASTLKGHQSLKYWKRTLKRLKTVELMENTDEGLIATYKSLQLSYDYLKSEKAKALFLLCSMFPEDYPIPLESLTRFAIGLSLFGEHRSYETLRDNVIAAQEILTDSCLLLQANQGFVRMHDLIRDVAQIIAKQEIQSIMGHGKDIEEHSTIRYLYCDQMNDFPNWLSTCNKLEFLTVNINISEYGSVEIPEEVFEQMEHLKILQLEWEVPWYQQAPDVTPSLLFQQSNKSLQNLRTLCVKGWNLGDMTFLEKMEKLETLEFIYCSINQLPDGILKLEKLRLLGLIKCRLKKNPWKGINRLSRLEELYFMENEPEKGSEWRINKGFFARLFDKSRILQSLQRYQIDMRESFERKQTDYLSANDSASRVLFVDHFPGFASHAAIMDLVQRSEILQLNNIQGGYRSVTPDLVESIGDIDELIQLGLDSCSEIEYLIDAITFVSSHGATIFNKLAKLDLKNMDGLMELCHDTPPSDLFKELQELYISSCNKLDGRLFATNLNLTRLEVLQVESCSILKSLFTLCTARSLMQLKRLSIGQCNRLKHIITNGQKEEKEDDDDHHQQQIYSSFFPKLNTIEIAGNDQLGFIFPFSFAQGLSSLEFISLENCSELMYLFGPHPNEDQLKHQKDKEILLPVCSELTLIDLPNFISIFPESRHPTYDDAKARRMEITTSLESQTPNSKQLLTFRNIRVMTIVYCQKLESLFSLPVETMLLEILTIGDCDALRHIIDIRGDYHDHIKHGCVFPKLKWLDVQSCQLLEYIFPATFSGNLATLESIEISDAPNLKYVFGVDLSSKNQNLEMKIHIPKLKILHLENLPNIISICVANCYATWPSLKLVQLEECPQLILTCINESREASRESMKLMTTLEHLVVKNTKIEGIFNIEGLAMDRQQVNSKLCELMWLKIGVRIGPKFSARMQKNRPFIMGQCI